MIAGDNENCGHDKKPDAITRTWATRQGNWGCRNQNDTEAMVAEPGRAAHLGRYSAALELA